ncbi:MAG: Mth938-like domain-containing protein [Pseudomonadota bacterium]|nr:Mth938-like domain-containing protein [Pseudomonadota bacterium]
MRLALDFTDASHMIRAYGDGWVAISQQRLTASIIVTPRQLITDWPPQSFSDLEADHFARIAALEPAPEIVILGTGPRQRFPRPELLRPLLERRLGVEVMDTAAACRTYNIILAEGRRVAAALLMI